MKFKVKFTKWHYKALKAFCALIALGLVLGVVYVQHQPYKYIVSHQALHDSYLQDDVKDVVKDSSGIWEWFNSVVELANLEAIQNVEANCAYEIPLSSEVTVENTTYNMYDPSQQDHACQSPEYPLMLAEEKGVLLSGNHEILTFGIFQSRSMKKLSREKSQGSNLPGRLIITPDAVTLDPMTDDRVVEACQIITSSSGTPELCLSRDGYAGEAGSSFSWSGRFHAEISRPAYDHTFSERYMMIQQGTFNRIEPCYSYNVTTNELIKNPPIANISGCSFYWVSSGASMRSACLLEQGQQATSMEAFIATRIGAPSVKGITNTMMGCTTLIDTPSYQLYKYFVSTPIAIQNYLESEDMYGTFFLTETNIKWMLFAKFYAKQLIMHRFVDSNTREVSIFTVIRNLGDEDLFYALVTVTFTIEVSGKIDHYFNIQYVPIVQYYYGLDGYIFVSNEVVIMEAIFLIAIVIGFIGAISYKINKRHRSWANRKDGRNLVPKDEKEVKGYANKDVVDIFNSPSSPPSMRKKPSPHNVVIDEESKHDFIDTESSIEGSDNSATKIRLSMRRRRNNNLVKRMEKADVSEISLQDFSSILLPDVEDLESISSTSDDDSDAFKSSEEDENIRANKPIAVLKKQVSVVTKRSTKSFKTVTKIMKKKKTNKWKKYFTLCVILTFLVTFCCRVLYIRGARDLHIYLTSQEVLQPTGTIFSGYDVHFEDIIEKFRNLNQFEIVGRTLSVVCIFFFLTQFFSYLTFDKRFNLVTATLHKAVRDILPMLVILGSVLFTYSVLGCVIYGRRLDDFSTVGQTMSTLLIIMLGEVGMYEDMRDINDVLTMFYFWTFVILVVFIIFNMVLALIFTLYDEEYGDMKKALDQKRLDALQESEKKRKEKIAAIKKRKFLKRNKIEVKHDRNQELTEEPDQSEHV